MDGSVRKGRSEEGSDEPRRELTEIHQGGPQPKRNTDYHQDGYIRVTLRELPHPIGSKTIPIEMAVIDTGKGIGKEFLKEQLFHPFSQENPLQTGTGLGLAIVNSIVRSENINGKLDVWSSEGMGTEIRVSFEAEALEDEEDVSSSSSIESLASTPGRGHSVTFKGFSLEHRGHVLSLEVLSTYSVAWGFELREEGGEVTIINEDDFLLHTAQSTGQPFIILKSSRSALSDETRERVAKAGGSSHIMYKPVGPSEFRRALGDAVDWLEDRVGPGPPPNDSDQEEVQEDRRPSISRGNTDESQGSQDSNSTISDLSSLRFERPSADPRVPLYRRRSEENKEIAPTRPNMAPRGITYHAPKRVISGGGHGLGGGSASGGSDGSPQTSSPTSTLSTISLADGGIMLKAAQASSEMAGKRGSPRVLVVEDNVINRRVLAAFLKKRVGGGPVLCLHTKLMFCF
jgi:CheY-like chemotaxis protein